jgi:radical SAM superfamily enzyme YgiQ (UPF0313 family)
MPDIVLATLNAKYIHSSFGLRYLMANLGELKERACMAEFQINQAPIEILEAVLALEPKIVGFGVYIWNVVETTEVLGMLRQLRPDIRVILGGPEVSYEWAGQPIVALADHVITGEADLKFAEVCAVLLGGDETAVAALPKVMTAGLPTLDRVVLPYDLYTDTDLANRILYVEASRGCPFTCEFCLSSLDVPVRAIALDAFLGGHAAAAGPRGTDLQVCGPHLQSAPADEHGHPAASFSTAGGRGCFCTLRWCRTGCRSNCGI